MENTLENKKKWGIIKAWLGTGSINVFGRPLSGKDTQAAAIAKYVNGKQLSGGQILREAAEADVMAEHDRGELVTQERYLETVTPFLKQSEYAGRPLVLSAVGRWDGEQHAIMQVTKDSNHPLRAVIYLELSEDQSRARLDRIHSKEHGDRGKRGDDLHGALETRFSEFANKTMPVIDYYDSIGLLIRINANQSPKAVANAIRDRLYERAAQNS